VPTALARLKAQLRTRFQRWISSRIPPSRSVTLDQKRIFIFPSKAGFFFGLCLLLMLVAAINYQNNMSFALTFLLATLFIIAVLHTFANLSGLTIHAVSAQAAFSGQQAEFELLIEKQKSRLHYGLFLKWPTSTEGLINLVEDDSQRLSLHMPVGKRGWFSPGRLLVESSYPLGLLRCWTWIDLDLKSLVYPQPVSCEPITGLATDRPDGSSVAIVGNDDFYGFRDYKEGDSLRQVHWKGLAKGQSLQSKQYAAYADSSVWLDWDAFAGTADERRLSQLCFWALEYERTNTEYGLRIPGTVIPPGLGEKHGRKILKALALYGFAEGMG
jgi:uncharacterized protein (DUF58 family)